jgi:hypothetical protein
MFIKLFHSTILPFLMRTADAFRFFPCSRPGSKVSPKMGSVSSPSASLGMWRGLETRSFQIKGVVETSMDVFVERSDREYVPWVGHVPRLPEMSWPQEEPEVTTSPKGVVQARPVASPPSRWDQPTRRAWMACCVHVHQRYHNYHSKPCVLTTLIRGKTGEKMLLFFPGL